MGTHLLETAAAGGAARRGLPGCTRAARLGLAAALAAAALVGAGCNRVESRPAPNVLLVTIDTLRADHVGAYGADFAETPTLDGLAARGVRFETVIAPSPITLPSHASLLTGLRPPRHGVRHNGSFRLGEEPTTLAERLRAEGYDTAAVVGSTVLRARYGLDRGFERYDDVMLGRKAGGAGYVERNAEQVADVAVGWLEHASGRPFFLWVHFYDPHLDHRAPAPFAERFADRPYDGEIAYVDRELARVLDALEATGRAGRTLVAVTSDHGESLGEHGEPSHGMTLYDAALRVPWLMAGPGVPEGRVVRGVVRTTDVAPTLLALAGADPLDDVDGEDLTAALERGEVAPDRFAYAETLLPALDYGWAPLHAIRSADHLFVRAPRPELYVLADDPGQRDDRADDPATAELRAALDARLDEILDREHPAPERIEVDRDERARLQALGYALPDGPVAATGLDPKDGLRFQRWIQQGARDLAAGRYAEAEEAIRSFLEHAPESPRAHGLLASVLLYTGRAAQALEHADRAIELDPRPAHRYTLRAEIHIVLDDWRSAVRDFERAHRIEPDDAPVQVGMLWVTARRGDMHDAVGHARKAFALAPHDPFLHWRVGTIWQGVGVYAAALESFEEAVGLAPDFHVARAGLAVELARAGRIEAMREHEARAGGLLDGPRLGSQLALAQAEGGDLAGARARLEALAERHPGDRFVARAADQLEPPAGARSAEGPEGPNSQEEGT